MKSVLHFGGIYRSCCVFEGDLCDFILDSLSEQKEKVYQMNKMSMLCISDKIHNGLGDDTLLLKNYKKGCTRNQVTTVQNIFIKKPCLLHDTLQSRTMNEYERLSVIQTALCVGADVDSRDELGRTPLILAVMKRSVDCVVVLANGSRAINERDNDGNTALHYCFKGPFEASASIISALIENGADVNIPDNFDITSAYHSLFSSSKVFRLVMSGNGNIRNFRLRHFQRLRVMCGFKIYNLNPEAFIKRLYYSGCPAFTCKAVAEMFPENVNVRELAKGLENKSASLQEMCRWNIRQCLNTRIKTGAKLLPIPGIFQDYVLMTDIPSDIE